MKPAAAPLLLLFAGCTQLGPMPATTAISAVPIGRPGAEAQFGLVPGYYASQSAQNEAKSEVIGAGTLLIDPDRWLPVKGIIVGGRLFGSGEDKPFEPFVGYRRRVMSRLAIGGVVFGSTARAGSATESPGAVYHGVRFGGEAMADLTLWEPSPWFRVTANAAVSFTRTLASGTYCADDMGVGIDCDRDDPTSSRQIMGKYVGVFPAGTAGLGIDFGKHEGIFNSVRFALFGTAGQMPLVLDGDENGRDMYYHLGATLALGFGLGPGEAPQTE